MTEQDGKDLVLAIQRRDRALENAKLAREQANNCITDVNEICYAISKKIDRDNSLVDVGGGFVVDVRDYREPHLIRVSKPQVQTSDPKQMVEEFNSFIQNMTAY